MNPYRAYSYDVLHWDDLGKWGHHLWELLVSVLKELNLFNKLVLMYVDSFWIQLSICANSCVG
jgi:hypothetical protein